MWTRICFWQQPSVLVAQETIFILFIHNIGLVYISSIMLQTSSLDEVDIETY